MVFAYNALLKVVALLSPNLYTLTSLQQQKKICYRKKLYTLQIKIVKNLKLVQLCFDNMSIMLAVFSSATIYFNAQNHATKV